MRVAFDLTVLSVDRSGAARYARGLREALIARSRVEVIDTACAGARARSRGARALRAAWRELAYLPLVLPREARKVGAHVLHCPAQLAPPARGRVPTVVTCHDALAWDHPEWLTRRYAAQLRLTLPHALRSAACVLVPSEFTRRRLLDRVELSPERVRVTPYAVDSRFAPAQPDNAALSAIGVTQPFLLTVGTLQPRKNIEAVIRAFERLRLRGFPQSLVIAGARGWPDASLLSTLERMASRQDVRLLDAPSDRDLVELYRGADCLVSMSRYEGFGFTPLEAMACGTPVVCGDASSVPEVVGDAGVLVELDAYGALEEALAELLERDDRRAHLARRGRERAELFTWDRCAAATEDAYSAASVG